MWLFSFYMQVIHDVAIVVPSCDKYSDLWEPLFLTLRLRWESCPFHIYLVSNYLTCPAEGVDTIKVGTDLTWSSNLIKALVSVPCEYVLLFVDDLFLKENVNGKRVIELIEQCVSNNWDYLRLNPTPGPKRTQSKGDGVGIILPGDWYRSSTVLSVWKKEVLLDVLDPQENAWELEVLGGIRTDKYKYWFACTRWNLPYYNLVVKGKIVPRALFKLQSAGIRILTSRPVMNRWESYLYELRRVRSMLMALTPRSVRRRIRSFFAVK